MAKDDLHILPVKDSKPHVPLPSCPCEPYQSTPLDRLDAGESHLWIHHAWDGREFYEEPDEDEIELLRRGMEDEKQGRVAGLDEIRRRIATTASPAPAGNEEEQ